jgi:cellulose synthase/poly-beta-1,6-N-acetylglucosamine synthase-like glycosyltransferase
MLVLLDTLFWVLAIALAAPCVVFFVECLLGSLTRAPASTETDALPRPRIAVLVPAHDESGGITSTLSGLREQLAPGDVLLVVADNCSDDTAAVARAAGAQVIERHDPARRGKGYALAFGLDHLAQDPPQVVIIVDADCAVSDGALARIAKLALHTDRPVQADYLLRPPQDAKGLSVVSALAFIVKNRVRPRGLHALGLPCLLTGTGMAFPWPVIRMAPPTEGNLVEDMVMGFDLAYLGHAPLLCPDAHVTSELPQRTQAASSQRRRWEHGHLATLLAHAPRLLREGVRQRRLGLLALAGDIAVPPLSLLVILVMFGALLASGYALLSGSFLPACLLWTCLGMVGVAVILAWFVHGRSTLRAGQVLSIPLYVLWKVPLYFSFLTRGRQGTWERTDRGS